MKAKYVQCECGQVIAVPIGVQAVRCSACGTLVQSAGPSLGRHGYRTREHTKGDAGADEGEDGGALYDVLPQAGDASGSQDEPAGPRRTWSPTRGSGAPLSSGQRTPSSFRPIALSDERTRYSIQLPGPFLTVAALAYPLVHPNWRRWLGLLVACVLATAATASAFFVVSILMRLALVALLAMALAAVGCLSLWSYVAAAFVRVVQDTAHGEERLTGLPDLSWWDTLPPFMQTLGAAGTTAALTLAVTYPARRWLDWSDPAMILIPGVIALQLFPILLITNLHYSSWMPLRVLGTLRQLADCPGRFASFLCLTGVPTAGAALALTLLTRWHIVAGLAAFAPIAATWVMFYGHWVGRLVRQFSPD